MVLASGSEHATYHFFELVLAALNRMGTDSPQSFVLSSFVAVRQKPDSPALNCISWIASIVRGLSQLAGSWRGLPI